jgi:hypothetical protein
MQVEHVKTSLYVERQQMEKMKQICEEAGTTVSSVTRRLIERFVAARTAFLAGDTPTINLQKTGKRCRCF